MAVAEPQPAPSGAEGMTLAERAALAWREQQSAQAVERAAAVERGRADLIGIVSSLLIDCLDIEELPSDVRPFGNDEAFLYSFTTCTAELTVEGECFEVLYNDALDGWTLYHHWTCPRCLWEADGKPIESLADFGNWLERAPTLCPCARAETEAERMRLDVERRVARTVSLGMEAERIWDGASVPMQVHGVDHRLLHAVALAVGETARVSVVTVAGQSPKLIVSIPSRPTRPVLFGEVDPTCSTCCSTDGFAPAAAEAQL